VGLKQQSYGVSTNEHEDSMFFLFFGTRNQLKIGHPQAQTLGVPIKEAG
jgi:hypothetical protein